MKPITNYKVVKSEKLSEAFDPRFIIIDADTGEIIDDAQGYGYKNAQKAHNAYHYKTKPKKKKHQAQQQKQKVHTFCKKNKSFIRLLETLIFEAYKEGRQSEINLQFYKDMFKEHGFEEDQLPFTIKEFKKYF